MSGYCAYFGFKFEPFTSELTAKNLLKLPSMVAVKERFEYVTSGGVLIVTGEVGSGKSTSLRWSQSHFHSSQYLFLNVTATGGSVNEFYRQLCWSLDIQARSGSRVGLVKEFKATIRDIAQTKKQKIMVIVDESHLLEKAFTKPHSFDFSG